MDENGLHRACQMGNAELVKRLLQNGAAVNDTQEGSNRQPLHFAAECGHYQVMEILLDAGAASNGHWNNSPTPLDLAVQNMHLKAVQILLDYGANVKRVELWDQSKKNFGVWANNPYLLRSKRRQDLPGVLFAHLVKQHLSSMCNINIPDISVHNARSRIVEELAKLKGEMLNSSLSNYDVMNISVKSLAKRLRNKALQSTLKSGYYKMQFPIYADVLERKFDRGMQLRKLEDKAAEELLILFPTLIAP